jgi:hypothetical protein
VKAAQLEFMLRRATAEHFLWLSYALESFWNVNLDKNADCTVLYSNSNIPQLVLFIPFSRATDYKLSLCFICIP